MVLSIVVVTADDTLARYVGQKKSAIVPKEVRDTEFFKRVPISVSSFPARTSSYVLQEHFFHLSQGSDGIVALYDRSLKNLMSGLDVVTFSFAFDPNFNGKTIQNYMNAILARVLRCFIFYCSKFDNESYRKIIILPLRNFSAKEIKELVDLFAVSIDLRTFNIGLERVLVCFRQRQKPKTSTTYRNTYHVDDEAKYFELGKERHAQLQTSRPPHNIMCVFSGHFRFGRRFDAGRHFNISKEAEQISGYFLNCHDVGAQLTPRTHINMFANDQV